MGRIDNYPRCIDDPVFWQSLRNTIVFTTITVPVELPAGLGLAVLLNSALPGPRHLPHDDRAADGHLGRRLRA